jgi:hypothetical protein
MNGARARTSGVMLSNGEVLVAGGFNGDYMNSAEMCLYT